MQICTIVDNYGFCCHERVDQKNSARIIFAVAKKQGPILFLTANFLQNLISVIGGHEKPIFLTKNFSPEINRIIEHDSENPTSQSMALVRIRAACTEI